jgi:hypothetical protein
MVAVGTRLAQLADLPLHSNQEEGGMSGPLQIRQFYTQHAWQLSATMVVEIYNAAYRFLCYLS